VRDQGESIQALARSVEDVGNRQRLAVDTLLEKAGNDKPEAFVERYAKTARARDEANRELSIETTTRKLLGTRVEELEDRVVELDKAKKALEQYKKDAENIPNCGIESRSLRRTTRNKRVSSLKPPHSSIRMRASKPLRSMPI
jgi:hypothetical protein